MPLFGCWGVDTPMISQSQNLPKKCSKSPDMTILHHCYTRIIEKLRNLQKIHREHHLNSKNWVGKIDDSVCVMSNTMGFS